MTGNKTSFIWRGYQAVVAANLPPITVPEMEVRLMNALEKISNKTVSETMVKEIFFLIKLKKIIYI